MSENTKKTQITIDDVEYAYEDLTQEQQAQESTADAGPSDKQISSDMLHNISVNISVEVGRAVLKIGDLLRLAQGSVVELDRIAGEPVDLLVNNTVVAQGEVVLVNERYGVRLTRVVTAAERLKNL